MSTEARPQGCLGGGAHEHRESWNVCRFTCQDLRHGVVSASSRCYNKFAHTEPPKQPRFITEQLLTDFRSPKWAEVTVWVRLPSFWRLNGRPRCLSFSSFQWLCLLVGSGQIPVSQHGERLETENRFLVARGWRRGRAEGCE